MALVLDTLLVLNGNGLPKSVKVLRDTVTQELYYLNAPLVGGLPVATDNPLPVLVAPSLPFLSLNGANAPGAGAEVTFLTARSLVGMQVSLTGGPATYVVQLQGSIDGVNWYTLTSFETGSASGELRASAGFPVIAARANLVTLTGGAAPTVTANILAA